MSKVTDVNVADVSNKPIRFYKKKISLNVPKWPMLTEHQQLMKTKVHEVHLYLDGKND